MKKIAVALAFACFGTQISAEPWTIQDDNGNWIDNPSCSSQTCHETGVPDPKPVPVPAGNNDQNSDRDPVDNQLNLAGMCKYVYNDGIRYILVKTPGVLSTDNSDWAQKKHRKSYEECVDYLKKRKHKQ